MPWILSTNALSLRAHAANTLFPPCGFVLAAVWPSRSDILSAAFYGFFLFGYAGSIPPAAFCNWRRVDFQHDTGGGSITRVPTLRGGRTCLRRGSGAAGVLLRGSVCRQADRHNG